MSTNMIARFSSRAMNPPSPWGRHLSPGKPPFLAPLPHQPALLALPFALLDAGALVVLLLALGQPDLELGPAPRPMQVQRHQGEPGPLHLADQLAQFIRMQQQL